jgi:hypothetical protein
VEHAAIHDPLLSIVRLVNFYSIEFGLNCFPRFVQPVDADHEISMLNVNEASLEKLETDMLACNA